MGKQNMYDHSVRVPFMVVGPKVEKGVSVDAEVYLQDIMPTTLELAKIEKPDHVDFNSILPILKGDQTVSCYDGIYGAYLENQRSVRWNGYKMILYPTIKKVRLYNLKTDPLEQHDLAGDERTLAIQKKLFVRLLELQQDVGDKLDLKSNFFGG
jgi:choline-sulfatase